jgi:phosphate transport system protein
VDTPYFLTIAKDQLFAMNKLVEQALASSTTALLTRNTTIARHVIENDKVINSYEIDIDNATYNTLTLQQLPTDIIRMILSIQKINAILERIGDHAVNIAESAITISTDAVDHSFFTIPAMVDATTGIFIDSMLSFSNGDIKLAQEILLRDTVIDDLNQSISNEIKLGVQQGTTNFENGMELYRVCKNLERIGDLSTNIAEETLFVQTGKNIKHHNQSIIL